MVIVLFCFCGCQWQGQQQPQSAFQRLAHGGCAYSEVPVAERDELSSAVAWSIHHWTQGRGPKRNQQKESHYLDGQAALIWSCGCASYRDTGRRQMEGMRQVEHRGRPAVGQGESTLLNAMINSRGGTFSICQRISIFSIIQRVFQSGWWLI